MNIYELEILWTCNLVES